MTPPSILIVEDEVIVALDISGLLQDMGYGCRIAHSAEQALASVRASRPDLILMDIRLSGPMDGIEAAAIVRAEHGVPLIFLTSHIDIETVERAARTGPYGYLSKPFQAMELRAGIEVALSKAEMERRVQQADHWVANTLRCVDDGVVLADANGQVRFLNPAAARLARCDAPDAIGQRLEDLFGEQPSDPQPHPQPLRNRATIQMRASDGSTLTVERTMDVVADAHGQRLGTVTLLRDVSEQVATAARLRASETRFRLAFDTSPLGSALVDTTGRFLRVNPALCTLLGRSATMLQELRVDQVTLAEPRGPQPQRKQREALEPGQALDFETRFVLPGGGSVDAHVWVTRTGEPGDTCAYLYKVLDLTERKRQQQASQEAMTLLQAVLDAATEIGIIAFDLDGRIRVFNAGAQRMLGYAVEEAIGQCFGGLVHDRQELCTRAEALLSRTEHRVDGRAALTDQAVLGHAQRWTHVRADGRRMAVEQTVTAMCDASGRPFGYLAVAQDISHQVHQESVLLAAMHMAEQANFAKSRFLANMSHEIRTPLNAVIGLSHLLKRTSLNADQDDLVSKVKMASKALLGIVNNVLDLSKIEAAELALEHVPFDLEQLLQEVGELASLEAKAKGIAFAIDKPEDLAPRVGDATRLRQVLTNLVNNALKFTERGGVVIEVREWPTNDGKPLLRLAVRDSGIGIAPDVLERLFRPFTQADVSTTRRFGGTGLGLSIVKQLVGLMGGEVGVTSTDGHGSEFWIELRLERCASDAVAVVCPLLAIPADSDGLRGVRAMVVDDSSINREVARRILELHGAEVCLASDGQEAVQLLLDAPHRCDVVLMDVQMPVLDGLDATRRIRNGLGLETLPIIALTAGTLEAERTTARAAGMNDFVAKPFEPEALVRCIRQHVPHPPAAAPALAARALRSEPSRRLWPTIEGIDGDAAHHRLGGDLGLFTTMLARLVQGFKGLSRHGVQDPQACRECAALLHNLKGSAGTLGAHALSRLAARAEEQARSGQTAALAISLKELGRKLDELERATAGVLDQARQFEVERLANGAVLPLDGDAMQQLLSLLRSADMAAEDRFNALAPALRRRLGSPAFDQLRQQIDALQFDRAADMLQRLEPALTEEQPIPV